MLDLVEKALHQVPLAIKVFIIFWQLLTVGPRGNHWNGATVQNLAQEGI